MPAARPGRFRGLAQELAEPVARVLELARVAEQRFDLAVERVGDVDPDVRLERARQVDRARLVDLEPFAAQLGEVVRVARRG